MDLERLRSAVLSVLLSLASPSTAADDLSEVAEFLVSEAEQSNVELPSIASEDASEVCAKGQRSLEELESMAITSIWGPHLVDLADISTQHVPIVIDEILDLYVRGQPDEGDTAIPCKSQDRTCELCERPAVLTEHHLIPRSEHDLFVKRGIFTIEDCKCSMAVSLASSFYPVTDDH